MADVIDRLEEASEPRRETWSGTATVTATGGAFPDGRQKITVSWQEQDVDCAYLAAYAPVVGDHVVFLKNGSSFLVVGRAAQSATETDWVSITVNAGFAGDATDPPQVRRRGDALHFRGAVLPTGMSANGSHGALQLPVGYRPARFGGAGLASSSGEATATGVVNASGLVTIRPSATLGSYYRLEGLTGLFAV